MTIFAQSNPRNGKIIRVYETFGLKYAPNKAKQIHFLIMISPPINEKEFDSIIEEHS